MTDSVSGAAEVTVDQIRTPVKAAGPLSGPGPLGVAAWIAVRLLKKPVRFGKIVIAARHRDVDEALSHDLDFGIGPVNSKRIVAVNGGPFVLGLDRSDHLITERRALYAGLAKVDMPARRPSACSASARRTRRCFVRSPARSSPTPS